MPIKLSNAARSAVVEALKERQDAATAALVESLPVVAVKAKTEAEKTLAKATQMAQSVTSALMAYTGGNPVGNVGARGANFLGLGLDMSAAQRAYTALANAMIASGDTDGEGANALMGRGHKFSVAGKGGSPSNKALRALADAASAAQVVIDLRADLAAKLAA